MTTTSSTSTSTSATGTSTKYKHYHFADKVTCWLVVFGGGRRTTTGCSFCFHPLVETKEEDMREVQKGLCRKMFILGTFVGHVQKSMETDIANYQNRYLGYMDTLEVNLVRRKLWKSVPWPYLP